MAKNTTEVLDGLTTYATRYGYDALGYALLDMMRWDKIHITRAQMHEIIFEYNGKKTKH